MSTIATASIVTRAGVIVQDTTNVRWPLQELLNWFNDGQRETVLIKPEASVKNAAVLLGASSGDGVIGCIGPIIRGDHRKRSKNAQIDMSFDTQLMGHFHQLIALERIIVNGSLKGYDEYASANNFGFEPPRQALWITHPEHGITFSMPVNVQEPEAQRKPQTEWIKWAA